MNVIRISMCGDCELQSRLRKSIPDENIIFHYVKRNADDIEITYIVKELLLDAQLLGDINYYGGTLDIVDT